jgi:hypothetical protein
MNNAQRALLVAAGLFLTIALITLVVNLFGSAQEASKQAQNDFSSMQTELASQAFDGYDNTTLTGSQVLNALRKYNKRGSFGIQVETGKNRVTSQPGAWYVNVVDLTSTNYGDIASTYATGTLADAVDESKPDYINPSGQFKGKVIRDKSNSIRGIIFIQQ